MLGNAQTDSLRQQIAAQERALSMTVPNTKQWAAVQTTINNLKAALAAELSKERQQIAAQTAIVTSTSSAMLPSAFVSADGGSASKLPLILGGVAALGGVGFIIWRRRKAGGLSGCRCRR